MTFHNRPPLNQAALRDLIEGGSAPFKQTNRSYILFCPEQNCNRQKMYVEKTSGMCKCFRCGFKGHAGWVLSKVYNRSPDDLEELLYGIKSVGTILGEESNLVDWFGDEETEDSILPTAPQYPPAMLRDPMWLDIRDTAAAAGAAYLAKRGIPLDVAKRYGIGFNAADQRVLFPVVVEGVLRGWQGRYIHNDSLIVDSGKVHHIPKAMTVGKLGKECFMFQDRLVGSEHAILTEGPIDCIKCDLLGGNVASMGKDVSTRQLDIIVRSGVKKLYVGLDRDADKQVNHIVKTLAGVLKLYRLLPPVHLDDLGECSFTEVAAQFRMAQEMGVGYNEGFVRMPTDRWG